MPRELGNMFLLFDVPNLYNRALAGGAKDQAVRMELATTYSLIVILRFDLNLQSIIGILMFK
jgi:hypothetical protein